MRKPYQRKTERWARSLVANLISGKISWYTFLTGVREDLWRCSHNWTNKEIYIRELAKQLKGVKFIK